ncbi:MAG: cyclic nucleotide-binding domain-containing protein [Verrucomicrobia bacterium]|nr:cyclic nucleotide-binding domain-containing protein [Verrucomicrobiota bacterium]
MFARKFSRREVVAPDQLRWLDSSAILVFGLNMPTRRAFSLSSKVAANYHARMATDESKTGYKIWATDNVVYGPVGLTTLVGWVQEERVTAATWIYSEQKDAWAKTADLAELQPVLRALKRAAGDKSSDTTVLVPGVRPGMLRRVKILAEMNDQQLGRFVQFMEVQKIRQFAEVVKQGSHGDAMFLVLEGELRVRLLVNGKETTIATLATGEFFGEMSLFDQGPRSADVLANHDSTLLKISAAAFQRLMRDAPDLYAPFLLAICKTLTARIRADDKRLHDAVALNRGTRANW